MSVIKIPSSHIYGDIDKSNANNSINSLSINYNGIINEHTNILGSPYTITLNQVNEKGEIVFVGDNTDINSKTFYISGNSAFSDDVPFVFNIDNKVYYGYSMSNVHTHYMLVEQTWYESSTKKSYIRTTSIGASFVYSVTDNTLKTAKIDGSDYNLIIPLHPNETTLSVRIAIYGNIILNKQKSIIPYKKGTPYTIGSSNEILQDSNIYSKPPNVRYIDALNSNVLDKYKNGKEIAKIKCSVGNYFDTDGNLAISLENSNYPTVFEKYDIVEPYTFTHKGEVPLSTNADGTPKKFEVIGIDFSFQGVVWQELTLQEYIE